LAGCVPATGASPRGIWRAGFCASPKELALEFEHPPSVVRQRVLATRQHSFVSSLVQMLQLAPQVVGAEFGRIYSAGVIGHRFG
jgi:hypothetical protein